jgi:hypothetical protein
VVVVAQAEAVAMVLLVGQVVAVHSHPQAVVQEQPIKGIAAGV